MLLRCPLCGAESFYMNQEDKTILFSIGPEGHPVNIHPKDAALNWTESAVIYCTSCAWKGTADTLPRQR